MDGFLPLITIFFSLTYPIQCSTYDQSNQGFTDITQVGTIPSGTTNLILHHNALQRIPANYFTPAQVTITMLQLNNNQISVIEDFALQELNGLQIIFLWSNQLKVITSDMFSGLSSISQINMPVNEIHTVQQGAFSKLNHLNILFLHGNQLEILPQSAFEPNHPTSLDKLTLAGNPVQCDCCMAWLMSANGTWITLR